MSQAFEQFMQPHTLTVLCTYRCTAACKQCCFESSPDVVGRLSLETMRARIDEAHREFPSLQLVVFSGGEALLLKNDLVAAIAHARGRGLSTRVVSNGFWGKSRSSADRTARALRSAGLGELNISTGKDHQEWVPVESVICAASAAVAADVFTLVTVEADIDNERYKALAQDERIKALMSSRLFALQSNAWMPFKDDAEHCTQTVEVEQLRRGCDQIFGNIVVTPHDHLSACCGLTLEHIPEMRLGRNDGANLGALYRSQADDFLKFWIHVDGPYSIVERLMGDRGREILDGVVHICQACVVMHGHPEVRAALQNSYESFIPEVATRFFVRRPTRSRPTVIPGGNA